MGKKTNGRKCVNRSYVHYGSNLGGREKKMRDTKIFSYITLFLAEAMAILKDTYFYSMQLQASMRYRVDLTMAYRLIPICVIGMLLAFAVSYGKSCRLLGVFLGLIVLNIGLVIFSYYTFIFRDYSGIILVTGFSIGGSVAQIISNKAEPRL